MHEVVKKFGKDIKIKEGFLTEQGLGILKQKQQPTYNKKEEDQEKNKVQFQINDKDTITLEPTWVLANIEGKSVMIGVKVIPVVVKSDQEFIEILTTDIGRAGLSKKLEKWNRVFMSYVYSTKRKFIKNLPIIGHDQGLSGDIMKDIIYGYSNYEKNIFCAINKTDLNNDFYNTPKHVSSLFGLKWPSIILCDEINKIAWFCMKQYKGLCTAMNYAYLYSAMQNKGLSQVYDTITDVKKSTSPFFRTNKQFKEIIGESVVENYIDNKLNDYYFGMIDRLNKDE